MFKDIWFLLILMILQSCSSLTKSSLPKLAPILEKKYSNFDQVQIPNEAPIISKMISVVQPELDLNQRNLIANQISNSINKAKIKIGPQIIVSIIDTESNFNIKKVSSTGDLSLAQVNVDVWNKELSRLKRPLIDKDKIKINQEYALDVMVNILGIIKERYSKRDRRWYARYHSCTSRYKKDYLNRLEIRMKVLQKTPLLANN